jgi:hypothetical protein
MNKIVVLTPTGSGSTILQTAIAYWSNIYEITVNPDDLLGGIPILNNNINTTDINEIIEILEKTNESIVCRLAYRLNYDEEKDISILINYLKKNFKIVASCRKNIFEYAISQTIRKYKNLGNIFSFKEKEFFHPISENLDLNVDVFNSYIQTYIEYENWLEEYFSDSIKFYYEDFPIIDEFVSKILNGKKDDFKNKFGVSFLEYCQITSLYKDDFKRVDKKKLTSMLKIKRYCSLLLEKNIVSIPLPFKANTFESKIKKIKNFNTLLESYNDFARKSNFLTTINDKDIQNFIFSDTFHPNNIDFIK